MSALRELQQQFLAAVLDGTHSSLLAGISSGGVDPAAGLEIYRNIAFSNFRKALADDYPVVMRLTGESFFDYAADEYARAHPSSSGDLNDFGGGFAGFLSSFAPAAGLPYLADVARVEWAVHESFNAADAGPIDLSRLAAISPDRYARVRFTINPAARLIASNYPVFAIWQANQPDYRGDQHVDLARGADKLLVHRGLRVEIDRLTPAEYALLEALARRLAFAEALDDALRLNPAFDAGEFLKRHAATATLSDLSFD